MYTYFTTLQLVTGKHKRIHLIPKWRIVVAWPSMLLSPDHPKQPPFLNLFYLFILFISPLKRKQIMTSIQDYTLKVIIRN